MFTSVLTYYLSSKHLPLLLKYFVARWSRDSCKFKTLVRIQTNECLNARMFHMSKLRLLRGGAGCRGYVLLTSAMRFSNFVSKFLISALTCESWIRLQTMVGFSADGFWSAHAEVKASFKATRRTITARNRNSDCILKFDVSLSWRNELYGWASREYAHFITWQLPWKRGDFRFPTSNSNFE